MADDIATPSSPNATVEDAATHPFAMSISLNILEHLGIGLYSNMPAVLSEIVANAWDADATQVKITINSAAGVIEVTDDGIGMTKQDINNKYLMVGYAKRQKEPNNGVTAKGRSPMGRKGIGKLSIFSIANTVEVYSAKDGQRSGLLMNSTDIRAKIESDATGVYYPTPIDDLSRINFEHGTTIILRDLKRGVATTAAFLRKRLARRFSIIGPQNDFQVWIGDAEITLRDRDYCKHIEFLWYIGDIPDEFVLKQDGRVVKDEHGNPRLLPNVKRCNRIDGVIDESRGYISTGWIGTVTEQKDIDEDNNTIVILANGKLIQEDIMRSLKEGGLFTKYLIGEINANFMDSNDQPDIVTSARQNVKEDDPRYDVIKAFVDRALKEVKNRWTAFRNEVAEDRALRSPGIKAWYNRLGPDKRRYARTLFGKIESVPGLDADAKKLLYKQSLLAFEKLALKESLHLLESIETPEEFETLARLFGQIDEIEAVYYYEIARGRIEIIRKFSDVLPDGKERLLQQYIFDHLWLLNPSWERAASNERIEESVATEFAEIDAGLTPEEKAGRIDIRYRTAAGKHIIIELKKYSRKVTALELVSQVRKYRDALTKCLNTKFPSEPRIIECICVLGGPPEPHDTDAHAAENIEFLKTVGARYITYDALIADCLKSYQDYLDQQKSVSELMTIINDLDATFDSVIAESPDGAA